MKLGIGLGYSPRKLKIPMEDILFAEKMGLIRYGLQSLMARMQFLLHLMFLHKPLGLKLGQQLCRCKPEHRL